MTRTITIEWPWVGHNRTQTSSILLSTITEAQHICFHMMMIIFMLMKTKKFIIILIVKLLSESEFSLPQSHNLFKIGCLEAFLKFDGHNDPV